MPFLQRQVGPVFLGRQAGGSDHQIDSLAEVQIRVLNGIIEQLSDISNHAIDIIDNVKVECDLINNRTEKIVDRVWKVRRKVEDLKSDEKVSNVTEDQARPDEDLEGQFFTPENRPQTIQQLYLKAEPMPDLDLLQPFREDDVRCRHVYSHPGYFFELWKTQFEEAARKEKARRKEERKLRKKKNDKTPKRKQIEKLEKIRTQVDRLREEAEAKGHHIRKHPQISFDQDTMADKPPSVIIKEAKARSLSVADSDLPPILEPPGPEADTQKTAGPSGPPPPPLTGSYTPSDLPPPPASPSPPVPPAPPAAPVPPPPPVFAGPALSPIPKSGETVRRREPAATVDTRSDLLQQIKEKRNLKKVQRRQSGTVTTKKFGIASIFEKAMEDIHQAKGYSDDEDNEDSDDWSDDE